MYKVKKVNTIAITVEASQATDEPGKRSEGSFTAVCKKLPDGEARDLLDSMAAGDTTVDAVRDRVLVSVSGIGGEGETQEWPADEQLQFVRSDLALSNLVVMAYMREIGGADAKNVKKSRAR